MSKAAGRLGSLVGLLGLVLFLAGIFGAPRVLAIAGVVMMVVSFALFFVEEAGIRRATIGSSR
jgi:hypothetical protein